MEPHWTISAKSRLRQQMDGEALDYPGRLATCPKGHVRAIPSRFSRAEFALRCAACGRDYLFREPSQEE